MKRGSKRSKRKKAKKNVSSFRFLLENIMKYKFTSAWITIVSIIASLLAVAVPYIYGRLFDLAIIPNSPLNLILLLIGVWVSLSIISDSLSSIVSYFGTKLGYRIITNIESEAYSKWLYLPIAFHRDKRLSETLDKISRGIWELEQLVEMFFSFGADVLIFIFAIAAMLIIEWRLAFIALFFFILYFITTIAYSDRVVKATKKTYNVWHKVYGKIFDRLYNIELIKGLGREREEEGFIKKGIRGTIPYYSKMVGEDEKLRVIHRLIYSLNFVILLGTAIFFLRANYITPGEFIMFFGYISLSFTPFWKLTNVTKFVKRSRVVVNKIIKVFSLIPESMMHGNRVIKNFKARIKFDNVWFRYGKEDYVLKGINLEIKPGEKVAIVGESGVGKTTLAELILGYYRTEKGKILLDDVDIRELNLEWLRKQIAIVPQEIGLFNDRLIENLLYANPKATRKEIINACKLANAHEFIKKFPKGYNSIVGHRGIKLSTGQKQRIAIAMAFLRNPKIILLDEPTSALDAKSERLVQEGLKKLLKGRTTLIIAHRLSTVREADKIIVLHKGKIVEVGKHEELLRKRGIYYNLYKLQTGFS